MYINVEKAERLGILGKIKVRINGKILSKVISAKSGKNGFVEIVCGINKTKNEFVNKKFRGNVKISFNLS